MGGASRAVVFDGALRVVERPRPVPAADEVLIRLRLGGICNTDLELLHGYKGFAGILGHEFVGEVVEGPEEWVGRRVVGEINVGCGMCDMCRQGITAQCRRRRVLGLMDYDGAFADIFRLVTRNLVPVPDSVPDDVAVFTEPLAAACQILNAVHIHPTDRVVLLGAGKIGLLAAQVLRLIGADLSVIVRRERQTRLLRQWGIQAVERRGQPDGEADIVVDCTGTPGGFVDALDLVRPRGTVVLKSTYADLPQADLTRIVVNEIRVVGSRCGPFEVALRLLEQNLIDVRPMIDACYPLTEAVKAFEHAARPGALKIVLAP
jgi:threonine dehydrogenase-like Zn-dependent dehydrogenase